MTPDTSPIRRNLLAQGHIVKKQLGLDDATWQALVLRVTGHDSSKDATDLQLAALIDELRRQGFRPAEKAGGFKPASKKQARLVYALWGSLGRMGALEDPTKAGLRRFCARQAHLPAATDPDFMTNAQLDPIISALKAWVARTAVKAAMPSGGK